jgi:hypothetical protein
VDTHSVILFYQRRIGESLAKLDDKKKVTERNTAPLAEKLDALNGGLDGVKAGLGGAAAHLVAVDAALAGLAGEPTLGAERAA